MSTLRQWTDQEPAPHVEMCDYCEAPQSECEHPCCYPARCYCNDPRV